MNELLLRSVCGFESRYQQHDASLLELSLSFVLSSAVIWILVPLVVLASIALVCGIAAGKKDLSRAGLIAWAAIVCLCSVRAVIGSSVPCEVQGIFEPIKIFFADIASVVAALALVALPCAALGYTLLVLSRFLLVELLYPLWNEPCQLSLGSPLSRIFIATVFVALLIVALAISPILGGLLAFVGGTITPVMLRISRQ